MVDLAQDVDALHSMSVGVFTVHCDCSQLTAN